MAMKMLNNPESPGPKTDKESTIVNDQWNRYVRARDNGHVEYLASAKKCQDFYEGDQWEPQDRAKLEDEGRPALTINLILATVNAVLGEQAANSVEFRYTPKMEGGEDVPSLMNKVASAIQDANNYDWVESEVFSDGVIIDRGFFDVRIQFDDNLQGEIKITADDPMTILLDPDASQYEPENWGEVWQTKWMSLDKVEETYGKKKRQEVENIAGSINSTFGQDSVLWEEAANTFGEKDETALTMNLGAMSDDETKTIRLIRVIERQHKRMEPTWEFVDMQTGDTKVVPPTWDDQRREQFAMTHGLGMIKRAKERIRWTVTADRVLLHDDWSPYSTFTKIPFFCYFRRGRPFGLVKNLLSPQEQLNKLASQELAIVNTTANSGWIMERNSLAGMTADDLRNQGAESGLVLEINPGKMPPEKIKPNPVPAGIERAAIKSAEFIRTISGVNNA